MPHSPVFAPKFKIGQSLSNPPLGSLLLQPAADGTALQINNAAGSFSLNYTTNATATNGLLTISNKIEFDDVNGSIGWDAGGGAVLTGDGSVGLGLSSKAFKITSLSGGGADALSVYNATATNAIFSVDNSGAGKVLIHPDGADITDVFRVDNDAGTNLFSIDSNAVVAPGGGVLLGTAINMGANSIFNARQLRGRAATVFTINTDISSTTAQRDIAIQTSDEGAIGTANVSRMTFLSGATAAAATVRLDTANFDANDNDITNVNSMTIGTSDLLIQEAGGGQLEFVNTDILLTNGSTIFGGNIANDVLQLSSNLVDQFPLFSMNGSEIVISLETNTSDDFRVSDSQLTPDDLFIVREAAADLSTIQIGSTSGNTTTTVNGTFNAPGAGLTDIPVNALADGTDGELITWDAAGAPATVAVGTANQVLTSNGVGVAPTFQAVPAPASVDYMQAYETGTQSVSIANIFQDVTFSNNGVINGWTHTVATADFTCPTTGVYEITYGANVEKTAGASAVPELILLNNGVEVAGSQSSMDIGANNDLEQMTRTVMISVTATQVVKLQFTSTSTTTQIAPSGANATTAVSASISIRRVI